MKNQWNTRMKHDNETQQWKATLKHSNDAQQWKQQSYNKENNNETRIKTTIVQQSYKCRSTMKNQWNTPMKHDNETKVWKIPL